MGSEKKGLLTDKTTVALPRGVVDLVREYAHRDSTTMYMVLMEAMRLYRAEYPDRAVLPATGVKRGRPSRKPRPEDFYNHIADQG